MTTDTHDPVPPEASEADPEPMVARILVVDDSPTVLAYTSGVLSEAGYEVRTCDNIWIFGEVASFRPDLILVDVNMGSSKGTSSRRWTRSRTQAGGWSRKSSARDPCRRFSSLSRLG